LLNRKIFEQNESEPLPFKEILEQTLTNIGSPSTKKAIIIFFNIFKKLLKEIKSKNYEISSINIEMTRDRNSKEQRKRIEKGIKINEKRKKEIIEKFKQYKDKIQNKPSLVTKLFLYEQQDHKDPYDLEPLDPNKIINDKNYVEPDHINALS
jgi:CRISPR-associated endonuclease Csn1